MEIIIDILTFIFIEIIFDKIITPALKALDYLYNQIYNSLKTNKTPVKNK